VISKERDYQIAYDAAMAWLDDHGLIVVPGVIQAIVRAAVDAVDDARARRQQEH
jgi:hypothetical protein